MKRILIFVSIIYLFFFSNRYIINEVLLHWEVPPTPYENLQNDYEVGVVLGGITNTERTPRDRVYFYKGADRIIHAYQLYKMGKIKKILVTGGSGSLLNRKYMEADNLFDFLILCGVNPSDIIVEREARNTHENAKYSSEILKTDYAGKKHLVITSGFHLRRSLLCFKTFDVNVDGFSTDFYTKDRSYGLDDFLIPDPEAFRHWHLFIHELLGLLSYRIVGYI